MERLPRENLPHEETHQVEERQQPFNGKTELSYSKLSNFRLMLEAVPTYEPVVKVLDGLCDQAARLEPDVNKIRELEDRLKLYVEYRGLRDLYEAIQSGHMTPELARKYAPPGMRGE